MGYVTIFPYFCQIHLNLAPHLCPSHCALSRSTTKLGQTIHFNGRPRGDQRVLNNNKSRSLTSVCATVCVNVALKSLTLSLSRSSSKAAAATAALVAGSAAAYHLCVIRGGSTKQQQHVVSTASDFVVSRHTPFWRRRRRHRRRKCSQTDLAKIFGVGRRGPS